MIDLTNSFKAIVRHFLGDGPERDQILALLRSSDLEDLEADVDELLRAVRAARKRSR